MAKTKLTKFRDKLKKKGVNTTFSEITEWAHFGNAALNYIVTGSLRKGVPNRRTGAIAGPSGAGKSFILANLIRITQAMGYTTIYIDTENAIDEPFLTRLGCSLDEDIFLPVTSATIEEVTEVVAEIFKEFEPEEKILVLIDSMSNLFTENEEESFGKGELANDMGRNAKKIKQLVKNVNAKIGTRDMFFIYNLHVYDNQDKLNGEGKYKISGGNAQMYLPSWSLLLEKLNLKEGKDQVGIKMKAVTKKTRYNQLGLKTEINIPWNKGLDPYFGILPILESAKVAKKNGAWYSYTGMNGEEVKFQSKNLSEHAEFLIDRFESLNASGEIIEMEDYDEPEGDEQEEEEDD